ncbi:MULTISPECIES: hypothetical protein [unclassified Corynebacterium]|uniref:hypothetical protein n=1 Tax=unclassified Corynebacterium TaxID=2624378 RepID=UPI0029CA1510|nr:MULTISPECIES: hypothetical protein [unclassified Corynebacterium]WPF65745.1 hypothetical protein OLX12_09315 [Corynebacterium sp. 22KM0430]WPF68239.1 hypothetical protein OLW90_09310 [Corynebacterium sp. 21KM1197]
MLTTKALIPLVTALSLLLHIASDYSSSNKPTTIANAVQERDSFTLNEIMDSPVKEAHVFCEYADADAAEELGFDRRDIYSIDNNHMAWETHTAIGVIFEDADKEPVLEYFSPTRINACSAHRISYLELDPDQTISVGVETKEFVRYGEKQVKVLSYRE